MVPWVAVLVFATVVPVEVWRVAVKLSATVISVDEVFAAVVVVAVVAAGKA
jgi:hypothetical protein